MQKKEYKIIFQTDTMQNAHLHQEIEFLYVMEGKLRIQVLDSRYSMEQEDFLVINSSHRHSWIAEEPTAVCMFHFDPFMIRENLNKKLLLFYCNSTLEEDGRYLYVRDLMSQFLSEYAVNDSQTSFREKSLIYDLLDYLIHYFIVDETAGIPENNDIRVEKMLQYINDQYSSSLSLQEMAEYMYMAPSTLSRFFKRVTGVNFLEYVNQLRLHYALEDLCYTSNSITWIAETHGFSNASAFTRIFKEEYGETPLSYRKKYGNRKETDDKEKRVSRSYLKKYIDQNPARSSANYKRDMVRIECDTREYREWNNPWNKSLNLGNAFELLNSITQKQIIQAKEEIGFSTGQIGALFSEKMMLRQGHARHITNYTYLDMVLDFLTDLGIRPSISMDNKGEVIMLDVNHIIYETPDEPVFETMEELLDVLEDFLHHIVYRYGMNEVSEWTFDCWYHSHKETFMGILTEDYVLAFEQVSRKIKSVIPKAKVGGWGVNSTDRSNRHFTGIMERWSKSDVLPDFISLYLFPYTMIELDESNVVHKRLLNNTEYYTQTVNNCRKKMDECGFEQVPIYVVEWNTSMSKRNYYNETCGKAAHILQMIAQMDIKVDYAAYKELTDLSGVFYDKSEYLYGGRGLINIHGAKKPVYYALMFLKQLHLQLIRKDSYSIITTDGQGSFIIVCFNAKRLKYSYYQNGEGGIRADEIEKIFEDKKELEITFCLDHVENGTYHIREYRVQPDRGSVLYEWKRLGLRESLDNEDFAYLSRISTPTKRHGHVNVTQKKLVLQQTLEGNEIRLIKISK